MLENQIVIDDFQQYTEYTDMLVNKALHSRFTAISSNQGYILKPYGDWPYSYNLLSDTKYKSGSLYLPSDSEWIHFTFVPFYGEFPHYLIAEVNPPAYGIEFAKLPMSMKMDHAGKYTFNFSNPWSNGGPSSWKWVVSVQDSKGNKIPLDKVLRVYVDGGDGTWVSKPIYLSSLLSEVNSVNGTYWHSGLSSPFLPSGLSPGWYPGLPATWQLSYAFGIGHNVGYDWRNTLPSPEEILRNRWNSMRIRITTLSPGVDEETLRELKITYTQEYATINSLLNESFFNDIYIPNLQVMLDDIYDVTKFVSSLTSTSLKLVVPDDRLDSIIYSTPTVKATLDYNIAIHGRITGVRKEEFANGVIYNLSLTSLVDLLSTSLDENIIKVGTDSNNDGIVELDFSDDGQYIASICKQAPGVNVSPYVLESNNFRPIETWMQKLEPKLVRLDTDYDWFQLYATVNKNLRGKLRDVAQANLYDFSSIGGYPTLVPLIPKHIKTLQQLNAIVFNMDSNGKYVPDSRLFVPEYSYNITDIPKVLSVRGLPTVEDAVDSTVPVKIYHNTDSGVKEDFVVEASWTQGEVDFQFTDSAGNAAVFVPGSIEITLQNLSTTDLNPFGDPHAKIHFIQSGLRLPNGSVINDVNGYHGVLGVRIEYYSPAAWTTFKYRFSGKLRYSANGVQGQDSKKKAEGRYLPQWFSTAVMEMNNLNTKIPRNEEVVENPFIVDYWFTDNPGLPSLPTENGEKYYDLYGYRLYEHQASRLADALALRRMLNLVTIEFKYVGHPGLKVGDFVGIARIPTGGVGAQVTDIDYFLVLDDFQVSVQAGGSVITSMKCGYVGTLSNGNAIRDYKNLHWRTLPNSGEVFSL